MLDCGGERGGLGRSGPLYSVIVLYGDSQITITARNFPTTESGSNLMLMRLFPTLWRTRGTCYAHYSTARVMPLLARPG